ncbi:MAG: ATP-binding protein [Candidatus Dormibacteraeota bacterium]|uniref:ATP-binding protein n=1 Tax=Candidatus Aeolococcus gillhamiae TaxID=3127015 RepID=A0A934JUK0_9BACT|nr:ATP-binding protein [Candidatus Dormibacteraeota bacterium]
MILDTVHHPAHRVTTAHLQVVYPGVAQDSLGSRGAYIGRDLHGGSFCYDPWELYARGDLTGPNMLVIGQIGRGKSAFVKTFVYRQLLFGRHAVLLDPKGENAALCAAVGTEPIALRPGGAVRLNPLDAVPGIGVDAHDVLHARTSLVAALLGAVLARSVTPEEMVGIEGSLVAAGVGGRMPTLRGVVDALLAPGTSAAELARTTVVALAEGTRTAGLALRRLVDGDLRGMFDAETSGTVHLDDRLVSFDLAALYQSPALGLLMTCVAAWLQDRRRAPSHRGHRRGVGGARQPPDSGVACRQLQAVALARRAVHRRPPPPQRPPRCRDGGVAPAQARPRAAQRLRDGRGIQSAAVGDRGDRTTARAQRTGGGVPRPAAAGDGALEGGAAELHRRARTRERGACHRRHRRAHGCGPPGVREF